MNNPTIVSAALSDKELQDSINRMVANFDKGLQTMLEHSNEYVGKIQASLQKIGDTNFGAKGSNDGGIAKQTKAQNEFTDAVKKSTSEIKRQGKEAAMSFDQIAAAQQKAIQQQGDSTLKKSFNRQELQQYIDRLRELQAEYIKVNTQQGGGVRSDKIKADMRNLEELIAKYREILRNIDYVNSRQGTIDVKKWVQDLGAVDDRYKKLVRWYTVLEKEDQRRIASEEKANQKRLADLEKEKAAQDKVIKSYQDSVLKAEFGKVMKMPTKNIDEIRTKFERLSSIIANIRELGILSPEKISAADSEVKKLGASIQRYEKFEQERIAAEQKFIVEQAKEVEQTQTLEGRVRELAKAAREYLKADNDGRWSTSAYGKGLTIYAENDARAKGLSIEEQIARQLQVEKEMILQQATAAQQLNSERKKYVSPTSYEIRDAANNVIANKLGIKNNQVVNANIYSDSIKRVTAEYKQLQDTISKMDTYERNSPIGRYMIQRMQELERQTQRTRAELSRPISLQAAKGISETTLDDMVYKLRQLQSYKMGLNVKTQVDEMKQVDKEIVSLKKRYDELMGKNQQMIASNTALGRSWNYMKNRLAFYFSVGASTQFVKNLIEVRSQYEMNERALGILINSAERGTQIFNELSQMALVSPYTLIELSSAAKQLTAYDVAARDVVDTTRRLADMAAAVGIPIERLTYALGQIKAYGYLNSRDARMFANAGIPLVKQLSDYYTELEGKLVSTADVYDRIKKKAIDYNEVMEVINKMTDEGGKFFDFQAKMADTLKVRLANLTLAWNNMLNDMGKESQGVLTWGIGALRELFLQWRTFDKTLKEAAGAFGLYKAIQLIILGLQTATKSTLGLNARLTATGVLGTRLVTIFKALGGAMKSLAANWWLILVAAAVELSSAIINANEATKEFNKSMREGAESTANDLKKYIEQYKDLRDSLYKTQTQNLPNGKTKSTLVPQDIDKNEASKAWEAMREQIELSSAASNDFVSRLLQIENVSDRLREGFKIIDDIQQVNTALKDMGDEALVVTQKWSAWWNAWQAPDGLFTNLKEFKVELDGIRQKYGDIANARYVAEHGDTNRAANEQDAIMRAASEAVNDYDREMNRFRVDLDKYTSSLDNFANAMEFSSNPTQVAELYAKAVKQLVTQGQLNPQEAFDLQLQIEEARTNAMKLALQSRIADEESALKLAQDERTKESLNASVESNKAQLKLFENSTYEQTAYWNDFTKYIKERHISELTAAYNAMTENGKKEMDFQSVEWQNYVHKWANSYEKSHNLATDSVFNRIKNWINDANTWSIFIKMTISTEDKKSVYKELGEWDKAADDAYKTMQRLDKEISRLRKKGAKEVGVMLENNASADDKKLTQAIEERTQAQKDYNEAVANGGESKKKDAAGSKAQKAAESELAKALKDELSTIDKVRSIYKDLTKEGMSHANAVERATRGWDETVNAINRVLQKNGLQKLDLSKFAGIENPRELVNMLQSQLNTLLKSGAKPAEIKELQTKVNTLEVDADKYDLTKITKGLNNELGKLKDEYELAVELDANPELGGIFADYMGIDLKELPKNAEEAAKKAQQYIDKILRENNSSENINIASLMGKDAFDKWIKSSGHSMEDGIVKVVDNYRQALHKMQVDESKKQMQEWDKLLEKYAEYEYKVTQIQKEAERERETARKKGASQEIFDAIDERERQELAKLSFEEFQKSPEWIVATGDLANMSKSAIGMLIEQLEKYKRSAKNLSPKQIKQLNSALSKLYKEQRKNNPFKAISNMLDEAKERMSTFDEDIKKTQEAIDKLTKKKKESIVEGVADEETDNKLKKAIERLKELKKAREETGEVDASSWVSSINETIGAVQSAIGVFDDLAKAIGGVENSDLDKAFSVIDKAGQGAAIGAQIGQGYGAIIGAVAGAATGLISIFAGAANERITAKVEESERAVKRLELAYIDLEHAVQQAYGMATIGANMAAKANKELQLVELKRQLALERSRDSKNRDEDRIIDLQKQIKELEYDIADTVDSIVNDLLGISSVGDAMENMMDAFIDALRSGEDAMATFDENVDEMIANMVKKMFTTKILQPWFEEQWNKIQEQINQRAGNIPERLAKAQSKVSEAKMADLDDNDSLVGALRALGMSDDQIHLLNWYNEFGQNDWGLGRNARLRAAYEKMLKEAEQKEAEIQKELATATMPTTDDIRQYAELLRSGQPIMEENMQEVANFLRELGLMKDDANKNLSALQQGIQGITEDTAGALEAYMNGVSQQVYLHSDLLTQIRDAVVGMDMDIQVATQAQMLLQLQQSYAVQMAIQGILEGWNNPSGQAVRVELVS